MMEVKKYRILVTKIIDCFGCFYFTAGGGYDSIGGEVYVNGVQIIGESTPCFDLEDVDAADSYVIELWNYAHSSILAGPATIYSYELSQTKEFTSATGNTLFWNSDPGS